MPIEDLFALFPGHPITEDMDGGFRTLGGFVMAQLDRIPSAGDHFTIGRIRFEVMDMDDRRVDKVLAQVLPEGDQAPDESPE